MSKTDDQPMRPIRQAVFASDLHLFSPRNNPEYDLNDDLTSFDSPDTWIILGGDIFDFRWSRWGGLEKTLPRVEAWLENFLDSLEQAHLCILPGNHDCHPRYQELLDRMSESADRLTWKEEWVCINDTIFLHGDVIDAGHQPSELQRYRERFHHEDRRPTWMHRCYDLAVAARLHRTIPKLVHSNESICEKLCKYFEQLPEVPIDSIQRAVFGHTHLPMTRFEFQGIEFSNPGAALKHIPFSPVVVAFDDSI